MKKKLLSFIVAAVMALSMLPMGAIAAGVKNAIPEKRSDSTVKSPEAPVYRETVNHNCEDCYYVFIDDIEISLKEPEPEPEPTPASEDFVAGYYFESDPAEEGWQFVDADGDGLTRMWEMATSKPSTCMLSARLSAAL